MAETTNGHNPLANVGTVKAGNTLAGLLERVDVRKRFQDVLGDRAAGFMSSIISCANQNKLLKSADPMTVITAAAMAATLELPINPALGFAHIVPYKNNKDGVTRAQFQLGWRGFVQLAQRSRMYQTINADVVHEGELKGHNKLTGEITYDESGKKSDKVVGYFAYFRLINGFEKALYMTRGAVEAHGKRYSKSFAFKGSVWQSNFDAMALKTVIKLLLSKWGPLSVEMQRAITADQGTIVDVGSKDDVPAVEFDDAPDAEIVAEPIPTVKTDKLLPDDGTGIDSD